MDDAMEKWAEKETMQRAARVENALGLWYRGHAWPESIWWCAPKRCPTCGKVTMVQGPAHDRKTCIRAIQKNFELRDCEWCNPDPPTPPPVQDAA